MTLTEHQLEVNDITISYLDTQTDAVPLLFIHGFPFTKHSWQPQLDALSEKARIIAFDLRGFGQSTAGSKAASMEVFADDLIWFMDKLNLPQAIVCGLSMGGYILLNAVERYPQRFKGIILSDTQCLADSKENKEKRFKTIDEIKEKGLDTFADNFLKNVFTAATQQNNKALVESTRRMILSNSVHTVTGALKALAERKETCSHLKEIEVPTLILCGKEDQLTPPSLSEYLFSNIPNAMLHEIEGAAHLANLEQPEVFNEQVRRFVAQISW